jgi:hypothetical protein
MSKTDTGQYKFTLLSKAEERKFYDGSQSRIRPTNIQNGHLWCPVLYDLSALRPCDTIKNGHKVPIFNVHGSNKSPHLRWGLN